jgi:Glycosyl transferase family 2
MLLSMISPKTLKLGRPRNVLEIGDGAYGQAATERGAELVLADVSKGLDGVAKAAGGKKFDLAIASDLSGEPSKLFAALKEHLSDGGHVVVPVPDHAAIERASGLLRGAGLDVMRVDETTRGFAVVARIAPKKGKLSLTVGMLSMNEEPSVDKMMDEIRKYAPDAQILLVDSSSDRTPGMARAKGATVIRQLPPRGHGPAMEALMYAAAKQTDALIYLDCDGTYPAHMIPRLRALLEDGADMVNASRTHHYPKSMPVPNFLANRFFAATAHAMHGVPTTDVHSGMRAYRSSMTRAFDFSGEGDALPIDTLVLPARSNYEVVELPIEYLERLGVSKLAKVRGTVWTFIRLAGCVGQGERVHSADHYHHLDA